jgi:hypothetical protein
MPLHSTHEAFGAQRRRTRLGDRRRVLTRSHQVPAQDAAREDVATSRPRGLIEEETGLRCTGAACAAAFGR